MEAEIEMHEEKSQPAGFLSGRLKDLPVVPSKYIQRPYIWGNQNQVVTKFYKPEILNKKNTLSLGISVSPNH